jgi:hypothetical protein
MILLHLLCFSVLFTLVYLTIVEAKSPPASRQERTQNTTNSADPGAYLPWKWTVANTLAANAKCPSISANLGVFAATNGIVSVLSIVVGNRLVAKALTCGVFGKKQSSSYWYIWMVAFAVQLGGNALIAYLIKRNPGYGDDFAIWQLMLFYTARPRLSWAILQFLARFRTRRNKEASQQAYNECLGDRTDTLRIPGSYSYRSHRRLPTHDEIKRAFAAKENVKDRLWGTSARSALLAEGALCVVAAFTFGTTVHFGTIHNFYHNGHLEGPLGLPARLMYAGAMLSLVSFAVIVLATISIQITLSLETDLELSDPYGEAAAIFGLSSLFSTWAGSWLFWVGYLLVAGDL